MAEYTDDINALLRLWSESARSDHRRYHRALTALLAERDALKQRVAELEAALKPSDRDLRERLLESVLGNVDVGGLRRIEVELMGKMAVWTVDAAIAEMRKGATDGK